MIVQFLRPIGRSDKTEASPEKILSMVPMPEGSFIVGHTEVSEGHPESISSIDAVLFLAVCKFSHRPDPVQCFGIEDSFFHTITWRESDDVSIYHYGAYKRTCEIIETKPMSFIKWYTEQQKGYLPFDIELTKEEDE